VSIVAEPECESNLAVMGALSLPWSVYAVSVMALALAGTPVGHVRDGSGGCWHLGWLASGMVKVTRDSIQ
jgi:hypothetical protein